MAFDPKKNATALAALITAVQIRWAESDLPFLETHPLSSAMAAPRSFVPTTTMTAIPTPAMKRQVASLDASQTPAFTATVPTITAHGIPPLSVQNQLVLGLAFIPLLVALLLVAGYLALSIRRSSRGRSDDDKADQPTREFRPRILSFPSLVLLSGISLTAIPLLELGRLSLPVAGTGVPIPLNRRAEISLAMPSPGDFPTLSPGSSSWLNATTGPAATSKPSPSFVDPAKAIS
jgi:hypothetical protein